METNGSEDIVRGIIGLIRSEGLSAGDRLPTIRELADKWDTSPNVVRDGFLRAQTLGLVKVHPRSGAFVQEMDYSALVTPLADTLETALMKKDNNLFDLLSARRVIEMELVAIAAARRRPEDMMPIHKAMEEMGSAGADRAEFIAADERFHLGIGEITGNVVLLIILRALLVLLRPYRLTLTPDPGSTAHVGQVHEGIYQSILDGDVERAREVMREHLTDDRERALARIGIGSDTASDMGG